MDVKPPARRSGSKREEMIRKIREEYKLDSPKVLKAMLQVRREKFVSKADVNIAYSDCALSIGYGQTISQPYTVAMMTDLVVGRVEEPKSGSNKKLEKVLEIGTGSGYQAAVLSLLVKEVYTLEIIPQLAGRAKKTLNKLGYKNIHVKVGSGKWGWPEKVPFDAILITAALEGVPDELFRQLKIGGVLVAPIGPRESQIMTRFTKLENGKVDKEEFQNYVFVPFVETANPEG